MKMSTVIQLFIFPFRVFASKLPIARSIRLRVHNSMHSYLCQATWLPRVQSISQFRKTIALAPHLRFNLKRKCNLV